MGQSENLKIELIEEEGEFEWIVTYADLVTLLLVFFILLFSISTTNMEKFKQAIASIQISFGESEPPIGILDLVKAPSSLEKDIVLEDLSGLRSRSHNLLKDFNTFIKKMALEEHIDVHAFEGKIIIRMKGTVLYKSGFAAITDKGRPVLNELVKIFDEFKEYNINIKGHTDNVPISTRAFPSNWELSAIRATTVLKYLIEGGIEPLRLTATGYGQLLPLVPNNTEENRSKNRRVEFVLEKKTK